VVFRTLKINSKQTKLSETAAVSLTQSFHNYPELHSLKKYVVFSFNLIINVLVSHYLAYLNHVSKRVSLETLPGKESVRVEEVVSAHAPGVLLHPPHGCHRVEPFPLPHGTWHSVDAQVVKHTVVCAYGKRSSITTKQWKRLRMAVTASNRFRSLTPRGTP
jgi:hypothetical protein